MVVRRITWPDKLIYTAGSQHAMSEQLSLPLFVIAYLAVVDRVKLGLKEVVLKHLQEPMADAASMWCGSSN